MNPHILFCTVVVILALPGAIWWVLRSRRLLRVRYREVLRDMAAVMPDCFILVGPGEEILDANEVTLALGGYRLRDITTRRLDELLDARSVGALREADRAPDRPLELEATLRTARDEPVPLRLRVGWTRNVEGKGVMRMLIGHDMRRQRHTETALRRLQRLESLEMLSHSVAHDLNNLLGSISVQISCAPHGGSGYADAAQKGCFAAASLLGQLTGYGRERSPRRECCSLEGIVEEALTLSTAGTQLEREVSVQSDLPGVEVDRHQMLQVFMNVLINARQAQPEGGRIRVAIGTASAPEQCSSPPPLVEVRIEDEGPGIPAEILPHIFESFYTTRRGGTGLGLAIAQSIVHRHEGTIELSSAGGAGTTCIVRLPACPERPGEGVGERAPHVFRGARIIVMDDNELIREALAATLEDMGLQVLQAGEGGEAIELYLRARAEGHPVDALIVDLTVSGGAGGARMMARLRQIDPRARVIVTSGYHYDEVMLNPREHGFAGALRKPFTQEALGRLLADILAMDSGEACLRP